MTDINSNAADAKRRREVPGANGSPAPDAAFVEFVELLFFAYRDFTGEADAALAEFGFGRAHHRVLHFVERNPGLRVADLLDILKITKQSLSRVLKQLIDEGYIVQRTGDADRRERRLYASPRGGELARRLIRLQAARMRAALHGAEPASAEMVRTFLTGIISAEDRAMVADLIAGRGAAAAVSVDEREGRS